MTIRLDAMQRLRGAHEAAVLAELRRSGPLSRAEIGARVNLSRTTLFAIIAELVERGAVREEQGTSEGRRGRPAAVLALNPTGGELIGIDLQRTRVHVVIANMAHQIAGAVQLPLPLGQSAAEGAQAVIGAVDSLVEHHGISLEPLRGVAIGVPGFVHDPASPDPHALTPYAREVASVLRERFGIPAEIENNARLAALAETTWGAARDLTDAVYLRWGNGIGGGLVIGGRLVLGAHGAAGEIGHVSVDPHGAPCHCGGRGCLETVAAMPALLAQCSDSGLRLPDGAALRKAFEQGEPVARRVVEQGATKVGQVLAGVAAHIDPQCVVLEGELAALPEVTGFVRAQIGDLSLPRAARHIEVLPAVLGADAAARGAVAFLLHTLGEEIDDLLLALGP